MNQFTLITKWNTTSLYSEMGQRIAVWLVTVDGQDKAYLMKDFDRMLEYFFELRPDWHSMTQSKRISKEGERLVRTWIMDNYVHNRRTLSGHELGIDFMEVHACNFKAAEMPQFPIWAYRP